MFWEKRLVDRLRVQLRETIERIPKDSITWTKEIKRLSKKRDKKSRAIIREYQHYRSYYDGKIAAYFYVLQELYMGEIDTRIFKIKNKQQDKYLRDLLLRRMKDVKIRRV